MLCKILWSWGRPFFVGEGGGVRLKMQSEYVPPCIIVHFLLVQHRRGPDIRVAEKQRQQGGQWKGSLCNEYAIRL